MDRLIERKQMSTKTTFKRIALVAVAALGFGMLSVVPSSATATTGVLTCTNASTITDTGDCTGIAGSLNYVGLTLAQGGAGTQYVVTVTGGTASTSATTISGSGTATLISTSAGAANAAITIPTPTAGTITVKQYGVTSGVVAATATDTVVITVLAAATGTIYSSTTINEGFTASAGNAYKYTNAATLAITRRANAAAAVTDELFSFTVIQKDAAGSLLTAPYTKAVTAVLSGPGSLSVGGTTAVAPYMAVPALSANSPIVYVYADGRAGKSTLTIAVNGVTVKSYDITFWGAKASYTVTANANQIPLGATPFVGALTVTALDSLGSTVPGATWFLASSASTTAASASGATGITANTCVTAGPQACTAAEFAALGSIDIDVNAVAKGSATFTAANAATSPTITATGAVKVTGAQIETLAWSTSKPTYAPGEKVTVTVTAKDSDGNAVGDGTYTVWKSTATPMASLSTIAITSPSALAADIDFVDGAAEYTFFAPVTSGAFTFSGTTATNAQLAVALQGKALSLSTETANAEAQAAIDAAAEATDAANAATDAANAAAEAADAATAAAQDAADAVAALSAQVATLISALKAQLTSLTNLVIKIQKKVKA